MTRVKGAAKRCRQKSRPPRSHPHRKPSAANAMRTPARGPAVQALALGIESLSGRAGCWSGSLPAITLN